MGGLHRRIIDSDKLKLRAFVGEEDELSNGSAGLRRIDAMLSTAQL
jgi:hypothetical protein